MGSLPLFAALSSRFSNPTRYLNCNREDGSLSFEGQMVVSPKTQFGLERSSNNRELVHIRCCYNNKYIVRQSESSLLLDAKAEKPEEETSLWSSTLFRPEFDQSENAYRFLHLQSGMYVGRLRSSRFELVPENPIDGMYWSHNRHLMDLINWDTLVILPDRLVFKGDNDRYLGAVTHPNPSAWRRHGLQFSRTDLGDDAIRQEIVYNPNGSINIKSLAHILDGVASNSTFWNSSTNVNDPLHISAITSTHHFVPVKVGPDAIALRVGNSQNNQHCHRSAAHNNFLHSSARSLVRETMMRVEEPVVSREVFNVRFRFEDARIYDETPLVLTTAPSTNTTQEQHWNVISFRQKEIRESSWRAFVSLELGMSMNFSSRIPIIGRLGFELSATFNGEYEWGETKLDEVEYGQEYSFPVPPMSHVTAYLLATRGTCDIPFDYSVRDLRTDGTWHVHDVDGGVFTGVNNFNFHTFVESRPLDQFP